MATQDISQLVVEVKSVGIQVASRQLDNLTKAATNAEVAVKKLGTSVTIPTAATSGVTNAINSVNRATNGTTTALKQKAIAQKRDIELHNAQGRAYAQAHAEALKINAALDRKAAATAKAAAATRNHNAAMQEAHALARGLSGSLGALWVTYGNLAGMGIGIAIGASLKGVVTVGADVEHTLEKVRVLGQATTAEVAEMSEMVTKLGQGSQGPRDVAEAFSVLTLAGLNAKEAMRGVGAALNLAVAGDVSIEKSSETLVQVATALGYTSKSFDHIGDVIAKTAATSMSSVESISASFMSAAASGEVYGARLEDMALGLAALANLGIKGTAAGTAQKNFYKDLASGAGKTTQALKLMGLTIDDLKNADGKFIPMYDMIVKIDQGMSKLTPKVRSMVLDMAQGERGIKQSASLIGLLYAEGANEAGEAISKLQQMRDEIADSAAFSAMAAMAMSQTTLNQMKAVGNTLQTSFVEVFKQVSPEIGVISRQLKAAFGSKEFISSLSTLVINVASFTKALVDNGRTLVTILASYAALKIAVGAMGGAIALARGSVIGINAVKTAWAATAGGSLVAGLGKASIAVRLFQASLGPLGLAIAALTTLWSIYEARKQRAIGKPVEQENLEGMTKEVEENVKKHQKELDLRQRALKEGTTYEKLLRQQEVEDQREAYSKQIDMSKAAVDKLRADAEAKAKMLRGLNRNSFERLKDSNVDPQTIMAGQGVKEAVEAERAYRKAAKLHDDLQNRLNAAHAKQKEIIKASSDIDDAEAQRLKAETGNIGLPEKEDKKGARERYFAAIQEQEQTIANASAAFQRERERATLKNRAGRITELEMVETIGEAEKRFHDVKVTAIEKELKLAQDAKRLADVQKYGGEAIRAHEDREDLGYNLELRQQAAMKDAHDAYINAKIKSEELLGNFRAAAELRWGADNKKAYADALKNAEKYGGDHLVLVEQFEERKRAAIAEGAVKEEMRDFDIAAQRTQNTLKGFKADNVGKSWIQVWQAATKATARYNEELAEANKEYQDLRDLAEQPGAPDSAMKAAEEAQGRLLKLSESFRQVWTGTGEQIAKGLETAFGSAGKALGDMVKLSADYQAQKDKNFESDMAHYGNLAGAASGFFDKQSKGYKVLNTVAQMFHIASMARTLAQTAASVAAGAAQFFAQSGWAGFAGVAAMGLVMAGLGFNMGSSGSGGRSAEEVQKTQGTGSVFGDAEAKSDSIRKSMENLEGNSNFMLPLTQAMKNSLTNIEASMTGLTNLVLRTDGVRDGTNMGIATGTLKTSAVGGTTATLLGLNAKGGAIGGAIFGPLGAAVGAVLGSVAGKIVSLWGSTKQKIVDSGIQFEGTVAELQAGIGYEQYASVDTTKKSWFGLSKKTSNKVETQGLNAELSSQFGLIFSNLEQALAIAGPTFGKTAEEVSKAIDGLTINTSVSLKDLKGEDLTDALNGVISKTMDEIAEAAFPAMGAFRQVGEGYAETVIRVASGVEQANLALEGFGIKAIKFTEMSNKTGDVAFELTKQSVTLHEAGSGVGKLIESFTGSIEDLTKAYQLLVDVRYQMNGLGLGNNLNQDTIKGAGGLDKLSKGMDAYYDAYFSKAEQTALQTTKMTEQFGLLGKALPTSRDQLRTWIEAAAEAGDQTAIGKLLALTEAFDELMDMTKAVTEEELDLTNIRKLMELLGLGSGVNKATVDAAGGLAALGTALDGYYASFFSDSERVGVETKRVSDQFVALGMTLPDSRDQLRMWIEAAANAGDQTTVGKLLSLTGAFGGLMELIEKVNETDAQNKADALKDAIDKAQTAYDDAMDKAEAAYDALERAIDKEKDALQKIVDASKESISGLKTVLAELDKAIKATSPAVTQAKAFRTAMIDVGKALREVRAGSELGKMELDDAFAALGSDNMDEYTSLLDFQRDQAYANSLLKELKLAGQGQLTEAEKALEAAEKQIEKLDAQLEFAKSQLDALKGIDTSVMSVAQALEKFGAAVLNATAAKAQLDAVKASGGGNSAVVESLYGSVLGRKSDEAGKAFWVNALDKGVSLDSVTKGFVNSDENRSNQLDKLYKDVFGRTADKDGKAFWMNALNNGTSLASVQKAFYDSEEFKSIPKFDVGTNNVPEDMLAMVHKGERIIPAADNAALEKKLNEASESEAKAGSNGAVEAKLDALIDVIVRGDVANVQKTNDLYKLIRDRIVPVVEAETPPTT